MCTGNKENIFKRVRGRPPLEKCSNAQVTDYLYARLGPEDLFVPFPPTLRVLQASKASTALDALRREAAQERDQLQGAVKQEGQEAGREKARLRAEVEAFRQKLDEKKKALDQEKVWMDREA